MLASTTQLTHYRYHDGNSALDQICAALKFAVPWAFSPRDCGFVFAGASRVAAGLAPEAQLFLHHPVGEAEQHRFAVGAVSVGRPARHDEDVVRLPGEDLVADAAFAGAFDDDEHGAVGRAVGPAFESGGQ